MPGREWCRAGGARRLAARGRGRRPPTAGTRPSRNRRRRPMIDARASASCARRPRTSATRAGRRSTAATRRASTWPPTGAEGLRVRLELSGAGALELRVRDDCRARGDDGGSRGRAPRPGDRGPKARRRRSRCSRRRALRRARCAWARSCTSTSPWTPRPPAAARSTRWCTHGRLRPRRRHRRAQEEHGAHQLRRGRQGVRLHRHAHQHREVSRRRISSPPTTASAAPRSPRASRASGSTRPRAAAPA